jgi:SAM-dependent methyltransferase
MTLTGRHRRIAWALKLDGEGIEYGPLFRPIIDNNHYKVRYVDFTDREALVKHYENDPTVDTAAIREIDIVTNGKPVTDFVCTGSLDYVVASHVWEHVPDFLGWLESNLAVLKPGGRIAVAYPDKRYCFDMTRRSSTVADVLAHSIRRSHGT